MDYSLIESGQTYLCLYGDARYRVTVRDKSGSLVLVRLDLKFERGGRTVGPPEAAEIGAETWVAPESIEPEPRTMGDDGTRNHAPD